MLIGGAATCDARCETTPNITCEHGDGCCPSGCQVSADGDCAATCGSDAALCAEVDVVCGSLSLTDACGGARSLACGTCTGGQVCGADGAVGHCGGHTVYDLDETHGQPVSVWPRFFFDLGVEMLRTGVVGPNDVWVGGSGIIARVKDGVVKPYWYDAALGPVRMLHATGPDDAWALTRYGILRFQDGAWRTVAAGFTGTEIVPSAIGGSSDDLFLAAHSSVGAQLRHFDGQTWSTRPLPEWTERRVKDLFVRERGKPWIVQGSVHRWTGLQWEDRPLTTSSNAPTRIWVSPTGTPFALVVTGDGGYWSASELHRHNGTGWVALYKDYQSSKGCYDDDAVAGERASLLLDVQGTSDQDVWFSDCYRKLRGYDGETVRIVPEVGFSVSATDSGSFFVGGAETVRERIGDDFIPRFDTGPKPDCGPGVADGAGRVWLVCDGALRSIGPSGPRDEGVGGVDLVHVAPGSSVWLAKTNGDIERRPAVGAPTVFADFRGTDFSALAVVRDDDVWALAVGGGAVHWDGSSWQASIVPFTAASSGGGLAVSETQVWAWDRGGAFQRIGGQWQPAPLPAALAGSSSSPTYVYRIAIAGADVWLHAFVLSVQTESNHLLVRDGGQWTVRTRLDGLTSLQGGPQGLTGWTRTSLLRWTRSDETTLVTLGLSEYTTWHAFRAPDEIILKRARVAQFRF